MSLSTCGRFALMNSRGRLICLRFSFFFMLVALQFNCQATNLVQNFEQEGVLAAADDFPGTNPSSNSARNLRWEWRRSTEQDPPEEGSENEDEGDEDDGDEDDGDEDEGDEEPVVDPTEGGEGHVDPIKEGEGHVDPPIENWIEGNEAPIEEGSGNEAPVGEGSQGQEISSGSSREGTCYFELLGVEKEMDPTEQQAFCNDFVNYINLALAGDPCNQILFTCEVQAQLIEDTRRGLESTRSLLEKSVRRRRLGKKKKKKNKTRSKITGECSQTCPEELLFFDSHVSRNLEKSQVGQDPFWPLEQQLSQSENRHLTEDPQVLAQRLQVQRERMLIECNRMRIEYAAEPSLSFHGLEAVSIRCGNMAPVVCADGY